MPATTMPPTTMPPTSTTPPTTMPPTSTTPPTTMPATTMPATTMPPTTMPPTEPTTAMPEETTTAEAGCPDGWIFWAERCYFFSGDWKESTWNSAKLTCGSLSINSSLVSVSRVEEYDFIMGAAGF